MKRRKYSLVVPFVEYDAQFEEFVNSLRKQKHLSKFEIIFVRNKKNVLEVDFFNIKNRLKIIFKNFKIYDYSERLGPSQSWCFGIKKSSGSYIFLVASDSVLDKNWSDAIIKNINLKTPEKLYLGNYYENLNNSTVSIVEKQIDEYRFKNSVIDFRNFGGERGLLLSILDKYFGALYFSDVELDTLIYKKLKIPVKQIPSMKIFNRYPSNMSEAQQRKFKHGIGSGRIYRRFDLKLKNLVSAIDVISPFLVIFEPVIYALNTKLSLKEKLLLIYLDFAFYFGYLLGFLLPKKFIKRYYTLHFDE